MHNSKEPDALDGIPLIIIFAIITVLTGIWKFKAKPKDVKDVEDNITYSKKEQLQKEIEELEIKGKLLEQKYRSISSTIISEVNNWESQINEIIELLPHDNKDGYKFDSMLVEAACLLVEKQEGSVSLMQRKFSIGYNRAERLMEQLELIGVVGPAKASRPRDVLIMDMGTLDMVLSKYKL